MTAPKTILVPTDFSDTAHAALAYAKMLADAFGSALHVVHVAQYRLTTAPLMEPSPAAAELLSQVRDEIDRDARRRLNAQLTEPEQKKFRARTELRWGAPAVEIEDYARRHETDLIAMGTHGRGMVAGVLLGSVADKLLRRAPCPVLVVRPAASAADAGERRG
jgi:nucleotide-binding universal stress UspA family protein